MLHNSVSSKPLKRIEHGFLHNVSYIDEIISPLQILEMDSLFESYGSKLGCRSLYAQSSYPYLT